MPKNTINCVDVFARGSTFGEQMFAWLPIGIVVHDSGGHIVSANVAAERILGRSLAQMQGLNSVDQGWEATYLDGSDFPGPGYPAMVALKTKEAVLDVTMGIFNPEVDSKIWINIRAFPFLQDGGAQVHFVYAFFEDITERITKLKLTEDNLSLYREIFDNAKEAIFVSDIEGHLLDVNAEACRLTKYNRDEILKLRNVDIVVQTEIPRIASELAAANSGVAIENRWQLLCKDGSSVPLDLMVQRLSGNKYLAIGRDATEREKSMNELATARDAALEANLAKTRFLAAASHDLRQPVQAIGLFHHALRRTGLNEEQRLLHDLLGKSARNLGDLLNSLLDISKLDAGAVVPSFEAVGLKDVFQMLDTEFWPLAKEKSLRLHFYYSKNDVTVLADRKLLNSLLGNLISNAIKYTRRGNVLVSVRQRSGRALIQVWDTGIGIANEHIDDIFKEYSQLNNPERDRNKGLGLGLAIVRSLAHLMNSEVSVRSALGRGSVFEFLLPIVEPPAIAHRAIPNSPAITRPKIKHRRVILVEDDAMVLTGIVLLLEDLGMKVRTFSTAKAALESNLDSTGTIDFYLSDLGLPDMNGMDLLQVFQRRCGRPIKAALLTGDTSPERIGMIQSSQWPVLFKPIDPDKLLQVIEDQMG
jgi:PAS domain S-box-containing protein